jgi:hypothetical protein
VGASRGQSEKVGFAPMLAIGVFLNAVAPQRYKNQIHRFFENPNWQLGAAVPAFVGNTFHRVFGAKIFSWRFLVVSLIFSVCGFVVFTLIYYFINSEPICKYPVEWCNGFHAGLIRETILLIGAMIIVDVVSFAQTSLLISYAWRSERAYQLAFIAYADVILSLSVFCFVLPLFLTVNYLLTPESETRTDLFIQFASQSKMKVMQEQSAEFQKPIDSQPAKDEVADDDNDNLAEALKSSTEEEDAQLKELAKTPPALLIDLRLFIRDNEKRDKLFPAAEGPAIIRGSLEDIEGLVRSFGAKNGSPFYVEQHKIKYVNEAPARVLRGNVELVQVPPLAAYSSLYNAVLNINHAFLWVLRGNPLFVDMNRDPLLAMVGGMNGTRQYICLCSNGLASSNNPQEFINQDKYLIFPAKIIARAATIHVLFEKPRQQVSLSVFFATSMFVTIVFYFGLLVFLLPAYAYRSVLIGVLDRFGNHGVKHAISLAVALGALPIAILLVLIARLL